MHPAISILTQPTFLSGSVRPASMTGSWKKRTPDWRPGPKLAA